MKRMFLSLFLILLSGALFANVRAPYYIDTGFSGSPLSEKEFRQIVLVGEKMNIAFPALPMKKFSPHSRATFEVMYLITNSSASDIAFPAAFLGINITNCKVILNNSSLPVTFHDDDQMGKEFVTRLVDFRFTYTNTRVYNWFFSAVEEEFSSTNKDTVLKNIRSTPAFDPKLKKIFSGLFGAREVERFDTAVFHLNLKPGLNILVIRYEQGLFVNERTSGYGGFKMNTAVLGFDYLLYPARSWNLSPAFTLNIEVDVPDYTQRGLIFIRRYPPKVTSNLAFTEEYSKKERIHRFRGAYTGLPADIFNFLISR